MYQDHGQTTGNSIFMRQVQLIEAILYNCALITFLISIREFQKVSNRLKMMALCVGAWNPIICREKNKAVTRASK